MKTSIKPCPFCNGMKLGILESSDGCIFAVFCKNCNCLGPTSEIGDDVYDECTGSDAAYNKMVKSAKQMSVTKWNARSLGKAVDKNIYIKVDETW